MDTCMVSSLGRCVLVLCQPLVRAAAWPPFSLWACGGALAPARHPITTSRWLTGATTRKHFSRVSVLLGRPLSTARGHLWAPVLRHGAPGGEPHAPLGLAIDDCPKKNAGRHLEGLAHDRHRAGSARPAARPLRGGHCVLGVMRRPLARWPGSRRTRPIGLERSLQAPLAPTRPVADRARSPLARARVDFVAPPLPERASRVSAEGGAATKAFLRPLPRPVAGVSR